MDRSIDVVDDRVIALDGTKATKAEVSTLIKEVAYDENTGIITFTRKNGATFTIDTPMEKIALNIYYDPVTEMLTLPLVDGTYMEVDLSRLITEFEFLDSDTVAFSVDIDGKVTAIVKEGSIQEKHLRPNYLADIKIEVGKAQTSAASAAESQAAAAESEQDAADSAEAAAESQRSSARSASTAAESERNATQKAAEAQESAASASESKESAEEAKSAAEISAAAASASETNAAESMRTAEEFAQEALKKAQESSESAKKARSYADGNTDLRPGEETDNAKYYYMQSKAIYDDFSQSGTVLGVKGENEESYRTGLVNLTTKNIGTNKVAYFNSTAQPAYLSFASLPVPSVVGGEYSQFSAIVSGAGNFGDPTFGTHLVVCSTRNAVKMQIIQLSDFYDNIEFGYWENGDDVFFGLKQSFWNYPIYVTGLSGKDPQNLYHNETQPTGWTKVDVTQYLPLTGGTLGNIVVKAEPEPYVEAEVRMSRGDREGLLVMSANGRFGLYDDTYGKWIVVSDEHRNVFLYGDASRSDGLQSFRSDMSPYNRGEYVIRSVFDPDGKFYLQCINGNSDQSSYRVAVNYADNADRADSAQYLGTFGYDGLSHGKAHLLKCQHDLFGDGKFGLGVDGFEIEVDWAKSAMRDGLGRIISDTYMPKRGGTFYNTVGFLRTDRDYMGINGTTLLLSEENISIVPYEGGCGEIHIGSSVSSGNEHHLYITPIFDRNANMYNSDAYLGSEYYPWHGLYTKNGVITTSDRNRKKDIQTLNPDLIKRFVRGLNPSSYKMIDGQSGRTHYGLIAQDIEELMDSIGMSSTDFAGFIKSPKIKEIWEDENGEKLEKPVREIIDGEFEYALRYDEFIAPIISFVQYLDAEVSELREENQKLRQRLDAIERKLF